MGPDTAYELGVGPTHGRYVGYKRSLSQSTWAGRLQHERRFSFVGVWPSGEPRDGDRTF